MAVPFAAIVLAMLPAVLDQTILATALPTIALDLGRVTDVAWLVTAYVVAAAASTPLWGKLGDRHGRKRLLEISLGLFLAASALCGAAPGIAALIVARAVQGVAAGGLMTLAMAAVGDLVSPRERARYQGYIAATFAAATVAGPLMGGVIVQHVGWRWVFYVNLPIGLAALAGLRLRLPAPRRRGCSPRARRPGRGPARRRDGRLHTDLRVGRPALPLGLARDPGAGRPHRRSCASRSSSASGALPTRSSPSNCSAPAPWRSPVRPCS